MKTVNLNNEKISGIRFIDSVYSQKLSFMDNRGVINLGDHVRYTVQGSKGSRTFAGIVISLTNDSGLSNSRVLLCYNYAFLVSTLKLKLKSDYDSFDSTFNFLPQTANYKARFKGSGVTGEISCDKMLERIGTALSNSAKRFGEDGVSIIHGGLPLTVNVKWLIGVSFKTFFSQVLLSLYPTLVYRFEENRIIIFDRLKSKIHKLDNKDVSPDNLKMSLLKCYSKFIIESKNVDEANSGVIAVTTATEQIAVPPFANNDYHYSGIEGQASTEINDSGLNTDHDVYPVNVTANGSVIIYGGQDVRMRVESSKIAYCKKKYGWDVDGVIVDDDFGRVLNGGINTVDYTEEMQTIVDKNINEYEMPFISGIIRLPYLATNIRAGEQVNLYQNTDLADFNLYVSAVTFESNGSTALTISPYGSSYIERSKIEMDLEEKRKTFNAQRKVIK